MKKRMRIILLVQAVFLSCFCVLGELNICHKCGYENAEWADKCIHCSVRLSVKGEEALEDETVSESSFDQGFLSAEIVSKEVAEGQKYQEKKDYELARLFFRNALAMEGLTNPEDGEKRAERLIGMIRQSEKASRTVTKECPRCGGTGAGAVKLDSLETTRGRGGKPLGASKVVLNVPSQKCKRCDGTGNVSVTGTIDDLKYQAGKAESSYRRLQQARKYEPVGNAWVPKSVADELDVKQRATLMRGVVSPCSACGGVGRLDCRKCKGDGRIPCGNNDCKNGKVPLAKDDKVMKRMQGDLTKKCSECNGRGTIPCRSCDEEGTILCSRCGGSGECAVCDKCNGRGYVDCSKCSGTAEYRGESCKYCAGTGVVLCSSCGGEGHKE